MTTTATLIKDPRERLNFLPSHFGRLATAVERAIFDTLTQTSPDYQGGFWNFYNLSNGGLYLAPDLDPNSRLRITIPTNGYSGEVSPDAAGIITCLFIFNQLCWEYPTREDFNDLFYALRDFAFDHEEAIEIIRATD